MISQGEILKVGSHWFMCGDIMENDLEKFIDVLPKPIDMIYSDPPWNSGNCKYWRTIANKANNQIKTYPVDFNHFISTINKQLKTLGDLKVIWLEASMKEYIKLISNFNSHNLPLNGEWTICYGNPKRPNKLLRFSETKTITEDPTNFTGEKPTDWAFIQEDSQKCKTVLDFCIGLGMTSRKAYKHNKTVYGLELNPQRLQRTIDFFLNKGFEVEKII